MTTLVPAAPAPAAPVVLNYVLDTNVFVEAHKRYYAFPLCPGYWKCLPHFFTSGNLISIDKVRDEISPGDALFDWVGKVCPSKLFDSSARPDVVAEYSKIISWANGNPQFTSGAKSVFAAAADGWLVAYALATNRTVVTHEEYSAGAKARVLIPNVCKQFGVLYVDTFEMLRQLNTAFDWNP